MKKKLLISLHNGVGDLVITFPFIFHLLKSDQHEITYETVEYNFSILDYFFGDKIKKIPYTSHEITQLEDRKKYDYVVDLNRLYDLNYISNFFYNDAHGKLVNRQLLVAFLFRYNRVFDVPETLSMSGYVTPPPNRTNDILLFTTSRGAGNRKLSDDIVKNLKNSLSDDSFIFNPHCENLYELCEKIRVAKLVVTVDTGPLHIAELLGTKWIGLLTNNDKEIITKYYENGVHVLKSKAPCSPCNYHGVGCKLNKNDQYDCTEGFSESEIISHILKYLNGCQ